MLLQHFAAASDMPAGSHAGNEIVHAIRKVGENLTRRGQRVGTDVGLVGKLVRHPGVRRTRHQFIGAFDRALHPLLARRQVERGAVGGHQLPTLDRHRLRHHQHQLVALYRRHHRQPDAGVPRRGLDDHAVLREQTALFGILDHRERDAILDAAPRIRPLELHPHVHARIEQAMQTHVRRVADGFENRRDAHGLLWQE